MIWLWILPFIFCLLILTFTIICAVKTEVHINKECRGVMYTVLFTSLIPVLGWIILLVVSTALWKSMMLIYDKGEEFSWKRLVYVFLYEG